MATNLRKTDVVVVGLGAVGGVAVLPLARAGLEVIGLEAGDWLTGRDFAPDELRNNFRGWPQSVQKANTEIPTHRPNASAPYSPRFPIHPMMNAVGGTSVHYWAQSWRLNPWDFKVVSETTRRYGAARIPKGSTVEDWPFGLEELEPYYDKVEYEVGVSGKAGNIGGRIDPRGNIFEGPRKREYPMPPLRGTGFTERMAAAAKSLGWHAFPGPAAINSQVYDSRPACVYHGYCNRGGCHLNAKNSTAASTIPKAQDTGRLKVVTQAHVTTIAVDERSGRVTGVNYVKGGQEYFQPAEVVLLAGYTYENVRMLLLSKSKPYPNGLANNRGQVGRHYFSHNTASTLTALFPFDLNNWYGLPAQGVAVDDWADDNFDHSGLDFIGGGNLWVYSDRRPIGAANMSTFGKAPVWGSAWKSFVKQNADRWNIAYLQKTTLPFEDNTLDLDPTVKDGLGFPVCRITADFKENDRKIGAFTQDKMAQWFIEAGAVAVERGPVGTMGPSTHAYGGTRMGDSRETNVVDSWGFSHEVPNLGVLGASVMGTSGAHNPTLTAQALAWRTAERLTKAWKTIASG
ncbi:MAG: GMC family oxidoreductase [Betaproteobacteria bacterium]|nr:MAG: GMC family oxidoreductase [Betaproteobacteria bacterium]